MNLNNQSIVRRVGAGQRGQSIAMVMVSLLALLGVAALVIDLGNLYYSYQQLLAATQAAALAGAQALPNSNATTIATNYSALTGSLNAHPNLVNVTMASGYPQLACLTSTGAPCASPANANAIVVQEQATVPTFFAKVFGITSLPISATATASARGGFYGSYNVMMVVDTTQSMNDLDNDSQCNTTRIACALSGVQTLLSELAPCASTLSSCGTITNGNVANPVDEVGLLTFPGLTSSTYTSRDYTCGGTVPSNAIQTYNNSPVYQIVPASSDYRTSDTVTTLNPNSNIVTSAGGGCPGGTNAMQVVGGVGTFYAGVINAAQAQLVANERPNTTNVMILISDGDATANSNNMAGSATSYPASNECRQAVNAAQAAANAGTWVYAVAYGAESSGCTTDSTPYNSPCFTMENIASSPGHIPDTSKFYSDYTQSGTGTNQTCIGTAQPTTNLKQIFTYIAGDLTVARLIPNGTH